MAGPPQDKHAMADQFSIGVGMSLSRSLGALGQAGAGGSTVAIVNTRDDGAPYLRSEKMSPKASLRAAASVSTRSSPGGESSRFVMFLFFHAVASQQFDGGKKKGTYVYAILSRVMSLCCLFFL